MVRRRTSFVHTSRLEASSLLDRLVQVISTPDISLLQPSDMDCRPGLTADMYTPGVHLMVAQVG